jgi:plasmid stabilization system protein ParE
MIIWHITAIQELQEIYDYVFSNSPQNAALVISEIESMVLSIPYMPFKNPKEPRYNDENVRFVIKWNYKIIYKIENDDINILSIFNTSQGFMKTTR